MKRGRTASIAALALLVAGCGSSPPAARSAPAAEVPRGPSGSVILPATIGTDVSDVWFTADGRLLIARGEDAVYALDPRSLEPRAALHAQGWVDVAGRSVLVGHQLWEPGIDRSRSLTPRGVVRSSSVSPRGELVARLYDDTVVIIGVDDGTEREVRIDGPIARVRFAGDDRLLLASRSGEHTLLDARSGAVVAQLDAGPIAVHATAPVLVRRIDDARTAVHDASDGRSLHELESPDPGWPLAMDGTQDGEGVILGSTRDPDDRSTRHCYAWDLTTGALLGRRPELPAERVRVPGSTTLYAVDHNRGCTLFRVRGGEEDVVLRGDDEDHSCGGLAFSPDGTVGAYADTNSYGGTLVVFDAVSGEMLASAEAPTELGTCEDPATSLDHGLELSRDRFGGCEPGEHVYYDSPDGPEPYGEIGGSDDGRYTVSGSSGDEDEDEWETGIAVYDARAPRVPLRELADLRVTCTWESRGDSYECSGRAIVTSDGATLYFHDGEPSIAVVDLSTGARRELAVPASRGQIHLLAPGALLFTGSRGSADVLVRAADGSLLPSTRHVITTGERAVLTTETGLRVVDLSTFAARDVEHDASSERWAASEDGSMLVRTQPAAPLLRIDLVRAALLEPVELPEGCDMERAALSDDARALVACVAGEVRLVRLDDLSTRTLAEDAGCEAAVSIGPDGPGPDRAVIVAHHAEATLVRLSDGARLSLSRIDLGQRHVWVAHDERGQFWVPAEALPFLRVRGPGNVVDAELREAQQSPLYREDLLTSFLGE